MLLQRDRIVGKSCLWRTDVGWFENTYPSLCADISGNAEVYILDIEVSWLVSGISFFFEFTLTVWISEENAGTVARQGWPRSMEGVGLIRCITASVACFAIPCPIHFSYVLLHTVHPPMSTCHCPAHCLESLDTNVCVLRISSFMKNKLPPGKTVGTSSGTRFSEAFCAHLWPAASSKGQRLSKHCLQEPKNLLNLVARLPLWKGQDFTPCTFSSFQKTFLCCLSKTFSFAFQGCFILWVGCGLCLQKVLHVQLQL